jgi:hypothetical protein
LAVAWFLTSDSFENWIASLHTLIHTNKAFC